MTNDKILNIAKPCKQPAAILESNLRYLVIPIAPVILFPGHVLTLNDISYLNADDLRKAKTGELKFVVVPTYAREGIDPFTELAGVGTEAVVSDLIDLPEGRKGLVIRGTRRMILREIYSNGKRFFARADAVEDLPYRKTTKFTGLMAALRNAIGEIVQLNQSFNREIAAILAATEEPVALCNLIAPHISIPFEERVRLLGTFSINDRMKSLLAMVGKEVELLKIANKIKDNVQVSLKEHQKRMFLHEQVKAIKKELGDGAQSELDELEEEIKVLDLPLDVFETVAKEIERMDLMPPGSPEYMVSFTFVTWIKDLPWGDVEVPQIPSLAEARKQLDADHYGLDKVKERILEYLAVMKHKGTTKGEVLLLAGPPGVGKTSLGRSIAAALNRPFERISLGGMRDESEIRGHRRTYIGSMPGKIITAIKNAGTKAPVILLDEIEKVGADHGRGDVSSALLEVLDQEQNETFTDHYLSVPYDLSSVVFIATANSIDSIPAPLLDRMELINVPSYTDPEKLAIVKKYLIPSIRKELNLKAADFRLADSTIRELMHGYTREAGVRQIKRELMGLARKSLKRKLEKRPIKFTSKNLRKYIGYPKFEDGSLDGTVIPGVATGLAWTRVGGDVLLIETNKVICEKGKGQLKLTGSLGKVMQESVAAAFTCLKGYLSVNPQMLPFSLDELESHNIHVHFPDGATPKDGPSAGIAILTAITGLFADKAMPIDMAMTGEISLRGRVLPVGGIREKLMAAHRQGKRTVLIPKQNEHNLDDLPKEVRKDLKVHLVSNMEEVLHLTKMTKFNRKGFPLKRSVAHESENISKTKSHKRRESDNSIRH